MIAVAVIGIFSLCLLFLGWHLSRAKEGWEDRDGFHFGRKPE